ncbi:MAG TPA: hypothetical protein VMC85_21380 [Desulfomonilaceae bacterium]|nr:hypothetical protein [Desulfomonilaceae bacterium]
MKAKFGTLIMVVVLFLSLVPMIGAQQQSVQTIQQAASSAAAKAVSTPSTGRPSAIQIRQNILAQKAATLQSQLQEIQRCILNASQSQTLYDPSGNINIVPQNDLTNCTRRLKDLQRQQDSLNRELSALSMDAQPVAAAAERLARQAALKQKIQAVTGSVSGAPSKYQR